MAATAQNHTVLANAAPTSFDPPDTARSLPSNLTPSELERVYSAFGGRPQQPGGTAEPTGELAPFRARGLYPEPGLYYRMVARDPIIASGLDKLEKTFAALPWRVLPQKPPTRGPFNARDAELEQARVEHVEKTLESLPFGLFGTAALVMSRFYESGFALAEKIWEIEESSGWWRLEDLVWVESWQVRRWITDLSGFAVAVELQPDNTPVPMAKMAHWGRRFTGRNYEGQSALRPLYWYSEAKRRTLVRGELSDDLFGIGTRKWRLNTDQVGVREINQIDTIEDDYRRHEQERIILPEGIEMEREHGGSVQPDTAPKVRQIDHSIARMLDDTLQELGVSQFGARAVGSEMRQSAERAAEGLARLIAHTLTRELVVPIYEQNGWPVQRAPYVHVSGFADHDKWRVIDTLLARDLDYRNQGLMGLFSREDFEGLQQQLRLDFGYAR